MTASRPSRIPMTAVQGIDAAPAEGSIRAWFRQSAQLSQRQLTVWVRDSSTMIQSLLAPALAMIMFKVVLGDAIGDATGQDSAYGTVPLVILVGAMFGATAAAVKLNVERGTGLLGRLYVLPVHRAADLTSRVVAELVRIFLTTVILLAAGHLIGFRLDQGLVAGLGLIGVALAFGASFSMLALTLAVIAKPTAPLVPLLSMACSLAMFFNSGFAPVDSYPSWLRPVVENQPMSPAIEAMRSLAAGGPVAADLVKVLIWAAAVLVACLYPGLRGYRRAAAGR
ncbi:MAG: ABC transporter permease [Gordonia sp. (in: high G+C Gram-positive bacteria)]